MAQLHAATIVPTKPEMLAAWVPEQPWAREAGTLEQVGSFRFDDPDGEVGIETFLLATADGRLLQVPLTYRAAPFEEGDAFLLTTTEHSVLGTRWVYDGCGDPAYAAAVATAVLTGGREAELWLEKDGELLRREPTARVHGSGSGPVQVAAEPVAVSPGADADVVRIGALDLDVRRVLDPGLAADGAEVLTGTWAGQDAPVVLVRMRVA
jgi:hypothetical protein